MNSHSNTKKRFLLRNQYNDLILKTRQKPDEFDVLEETLEVGNQLYKKVKTPREAIIDSELLTLQTEIVKNKTDQIDVTLFDFQPVDFIRRMKRDSNEVFLRQVGIEFIEIINDTPSFQTMFGSLPENLIVKKTPSKVNQQKNETKAVKLKASQGESTSSYSSGGERKEVQPSVEAQRILTILRGLCSKYQGPLCYFEFVIHPSSFSKTIENMFYVSYLIKEGYVSLSEDSDHLPAIYPAEMVSEELKDEKLSNSSVISLTIADWEDLIETFDLKGRPPVIPPRREN